MARQCISVCDGTILRHQFLLHVTGIMITQTFATTATQYGQRSMCAHTLDMSPIKIIFKSFLNIRSKVSAILACFSIPHIHQLSREEIAKECEPMCFSRKRLDDMTDRMKCKLYHQPSQKPVAGLQLPVLRERSPFRNPRDFASHVPE